MRRLASSYTLAGAVDIGKAPKRELSSHAREGWRINARIAVMCMTE